MFSLVTTVVLFYFSQAQNVCDDASECASTTLTGSLAECYGYEGCESADIDTTTTYCYGYEACENADIDSSGDAYCSGLNSCQSATITADSVICDGDYGCQSSTIDSDSTVKCDGDYSCYESTGNLDTDLSCNGNFACYGSTFTLDAGEASVVYVGGNRGGSTATIDSADSKTGSIKLLSYGFWGSSHSTTKSGESNTLLVRFGGYLSGYEANVYCESGSTCTLECYGYGCQDTTLYCDSSASCTINCIHEPDSSYCATQTSSMDDMNKKNKILSIEDLQKLSYPDTDELAHHETLTKDILQIHQDKAKVMAAEAKKTRQQRSDANILQGGEKSKKFINSKHFWQVVGVAGFGFGVISLGILCCQTGKYKDYTRI